VKKRLKVNGVIMGFAALAIAFFPRFFLRVYSGGIQEEILEAAGFALILLGQIIRVSARGYKAEHSQDSWALIQGGPYQVVRNPMYLGIFLIGLGVVLAIFRWWAAAVFIGRKKILAECFRKLIRNIAGRYPVFFRSYLA
jgi:protein-S-isoprenylcysteine O-methyltransferase Ste14